MELIGLGKQGAVSGGLHSILLSQAMRGTAGFALGGLGSAAAVATAAFGGTLAFLRARDSNALDESKCVAVPPNDKWVVAQEEDGFGPDHVKFYAYDSESEAWGAACEHTNWRRIVYAPGMREVGWLGWNVWSDEAIRQRVGKRL